MNCCVLHLELGHDRGSIHSVHHRRARVQNLNLAHESLMSSVVRQLFPTLPAHKAGLSSPL
jgi:hypothetical protein